MALPVCRADDPVTATSSPAPAQVPQQQPYPAHQRNSSRSTIPKLNKTNSVSSVLSERSRAHLEYINSLPVPSKEEIAQIAQVQNEREVQLKQRRRSQRQSVDFAAPNVHHQDQDPSVRPPNPSRSSLVARLGFGRRKSSAAEDGSVTEAATVIQRTYRGYRARRELRGYSLDASTRWVHAVKEAQWRDMNRPRPRSEILEDGFISSGFPSPSPSPGELGSDGVLSPSRTPTARLNWKKASTIARRAGNDADVTSDPSSSSSDSESDEYRKEQKRIAQQRRAEAKAKRKETSRTMGLQYFLEMVDLKHRYGSNLRVYHEEWQKADTNENFFYWLDHGEGRHVDIEACPREVLEREQVRYLSREERQHYLVTVDDEGRLIWAKNRARIDTTEKWKDSIKGIVPSDDPTPAYTPISENTTNFLGDSTTEPSSNSSDSSDSDSDESRLESARAKRYATPSFTEAKGVKKIKHVSASTIFNKLLRKSVRKNTWIFVADTSFRLYVGIKNSGAFQHSSFLQGSRISAAGLIKIKDGTLHSLSPLSGHYRPPASNFRAFVHSLKDEGVDMSHVSISKSYAVLVGLETYVKIRKKGKDVVGKVAHRKEKIVRPEETRLKEEEQRDKSESAKREEEVLKEEGREQEENKVSVQVKQKLEDWTGPRSREPRGQLGDGADHWEGVERG
ncbi:hypothetical protein QBC35DRAFT_512233 [Podospora australis]|uniref:IQ domain-containing protein IQM6 n=1 Tax=Podospora australis TaxID=1536484 RepID=A0AAN6X1Y2_9PEZI|nr:hypothetical protein QBC35DRAFT_512233 [Podospora australis]